MTEPKHKAGADLFIVDNSDSDWKVLNYLREWTEISRAFDIATGYFEIGALLALDGHWQNLEQLRILMGDEVTRRTKKALAEGVALAKQVLDRSLEQEKEQNDFLQGVPAIVEALASGKIRCRVYNRDRFHAKAYITHGKLAVVGPAALVGSSNFTACGLTSNVELNVQLRREVELLQEWYERHWDQAQEITSEILRVIERHTREYTPFEVYAKALQQFVEGHEMSVGEWELTRSQMYPHLDQYQKEGYQALLKIARQYGGAFLCDGVGLGKTFIGLMAIERLTQFEKKNVALFVPKAARFAVWENKISKYLPELAGGRDFSNLVVLNHTDLLRGGDYPERLHRIRERADVIVIDEAHHFRNLGLKDKSRYWHMSELCAGKTVLLLTATPVNNSLLDLQHMIELFSQREPDHFKGAPLGIHSLPGHFRKMEKALEKLVGASSGNGEVETNEAEAERVLRDDALFRALVVQRSRAYVKASQKQHDGGSAIFPQREPPKVVAYALKKTYGRLLDQVEEAFSKEKPLFSLAIYYPLAYYKGPDASINPLDENRQKAVVTLIRTGFLKRFESSARAFERSCETLLLKLLTFATKHSQTATEVKVLDRWKAQHTRTIERVHDHVHKYEESEFDADEDVISPEMLEHVEELDRAEYKVEEILDETFLDLDQVVAFLDELAKFKPSHDDKLQALLKLMRADKILSKQKVLIFSEFMATARYLREELDMNGIVGVEEVDSSIGRDRAEVLRQFAPYYNDSSPAELVAEGLEETRVLISTDVLSEGLNLQDATLLINYDLHWNPVRVMQRIGRVDRRLDPEVEERIAREHPERAAIRGTVRYWNFLPPDELEVLLRLYGRVSHKTLKISKTFGIEGKKLLTPEDDYEALKDFTHEYEGSPNFNEKLRLEYQELLAAQPDLAERLKAFPGRIFSGRQHPVEGHQAAFFCYALPAPDLSGAVPEGEGLPWTEAAGRVGWYLFDLASGAIEEAPESIVDVIRSQPNTQRKRGIEDRMLTEIRAKVEKHIKNTYLKRVDAPVGVKPVLKCWMELNEG